MSARGSPGSGLDCPANETNALRCRNPTEIGSGGAPLEVLPDTQLTYNFRNAQPRPALLVPTSDCLANYLLPGGFRVPAQSFHSVWLHACSGSAWAALCHYPVFQCWSGK